MEYSSPFSSRYASREMSRLFSEEHRAICFRMLWIALAKAEKSLGLPVAPSQIREMQSQLRKVDLDAIRTFEEQSKHDVMAHIQAFGAQCPKAKGIIHLGATSCYVTDNADLLIYREGFTLLLHKLARVIRILADFATKYAHLPCLGYTHFQPAQPTTVGKRASLWLHDFLFDALEWERLLSSFPFLGAKGATGTQSSFLQLFNGNHSKVEKMEELIAKQFKFSKVLPISGQTYTRKIDLTILNALASFASSAHKMGTDLRLLAHEGEIYESQDQHQVGSSAMPHKKNPIYSERICGLSRFGMSLAQNGAYTAATQWLERSLDDSSNRRIVMPEAFLCTDAILNHLYHLVTHLIVQPKNVQLNLEKMIPFISMEPILMTLSRKGGDRQEIHEKLRKIAERIEQKENRIDAFYKEIKTSFDLNKKDLIHLLKPEIMIGCAPHQVKEFMKNEIAPFLKRYRRSEPQMPPAAI